MRGDKSFAYDLIVWPGRVSGRVALLLRSTERKPVRQLDLLRKLSPICDPLDVVLRWGRVSRSSYMGLPSLIAPLTGALREGVGMQVVIEKSSRS